MRILASVLFAAFVLASQGQAQEGLSALEVAELTCIGPGPEIADPFEELRGLPRENCEKACKAAVKGCQAVVKAVDKCGVAFLKSAGKVALPICQGLGGTKSECKAVKSIVRSDIATWRAGGDVERDACVAEGQDCFNVCQ
jgi:hypothetical protein